VSADLFALMEDVEGGAPRTQLRGCLALVRVEGSLQSALLALYIAKLESRHARKESRGGQERVEQ